MARSDAIVDGTVELPRAVLERNLGAVGRARGE
jgi:hypothetical protein